MRQFNATCRRPAMIGGTPTASTAAWLKILRPIMTPIFRPFRGMYIESDDIGRAMLAATRQNLGARILENPEMRALAQSQRCSS